MTHHLLADLQFQQPLVPDSAPFNPVKPGAAPVSVAETILSRFLMVLTIIGGGTFLINFVVGALNWITAGGDQSKLEKAQKTISTSFIGLVIMALSYILASLASKVTGIEFLDLNKAFQSIIKP